MFRSSLFYSFRTDEQKVRFPEDNVNEDDKGKEGVEDEGVQNKDDVEPDSVPPVTCRQDTVSKDLLPNGLLVIELILFVTTSPRLKCGDALVAGRMA